MESQIGCYFSLVADAVDFGGRRPVDAFPDSARAKRRQVAALENQTKPSIRIAVACLAMLLAQNVFCGFVSRAADTTQQIAAFSFADVKYFHRYTKDDQHEYTPAGQEDLNAWTDMVTILLYRNAKDAEALATTANAVLETYKANKALVVKTDSVPRTRDKPAEHLIVVTFGRPEFIEVAFARFKMHDGIGSAVVYSHRIYGNKVGDAMSVWLRTNGLSTESNLMKWDAMPKLLSPR